MMWKCLLALPALLPIAAAAQTPTTIQRGAVAAPGVVNDAFAGKQDVNGDASGQRVLPAGAAVLQELRAFLGEIEVTPDWFKLPADGDDDMPSIIRAQATGKIVRFRCRHYTLRTRGVFTSPVRWLGCGAQEFAGNEAGAPPLDGTWLDADASFKVGSGSPNAGQSVVRIQGTLTAGSFIEGFGISQPQQRPLGGQTSWAPTEYGHVFAVDGVSGQVRFANLFFFGVDQGISSVGSGRTELERVRGHWFRNALRIDQAYDISRVLDLHSWSYWCDCTAVATYTQHNLDVIVSGRSDSPFIERLFSIFARSGMRWTNFGSGTTTGAAIGTFSCDFSWSCLWVDSAATTVTAQIGALRSFAQAQDRGPQYAMASISGTTMTVTSIGDSYFAVGQIVRAQTGNAVAPGTTITALGTGTGGVGTYTVSISQNVPSMNVATVLYPTVKMLDDSSVIRVDGGATFNVQSLNDFGTARGSVVLTSSSIASNITLGSLRLDHVEFGSPNFAAVSTAVPSPRHRVEVSSLPQLYGKPPVGFAQILPGSSAQFVIPATYEGPWETSSVAVSALTGTLGSATAELRYRRVGATLMFDLRVDISSNGTGAGQVRVAMPFAVPRDVIVAGRSVATGKMLQGLIPAGTSTLILLNYDNSYPGGNTTRLLASGTGEITAP